MTSAEDRILGWLGLLRLSRRRGVDARALLERLGEPYRWLAPGGAAPPSEEPRIDAWIRALDWREVERDLRWLRTSGARVVGWHDPDYPALLREIPDPPIAFYCLGALSCDRPMLAVVGSRHATHAGRTAAREMAFELTRGGLGIVSGMALGIDAEAHRGALAAGGPTVAVLGGGLARIYPRQHVGLAAEIAAHGAVISEYPPGEPPAPHNFPHRNRLISGLSLGVLVVEAAQRSGSLITARLAGEQGREVLAMPGAVANPLSRGCHRLIRDGAVLVETAADVLCELAPGWRTSSPAAGTATVAGRGGPQATEARSESAPAPGLARQVLDCIDFTATAVDAIVARSGLTADVVSSMLLALELDGHVRAELGGVYVRSPVGPR
jgi:DNA processing protein